MWLQVPKLRELNRRHFFFPRAAPVDVAPWHLHRIAKPRAEPWEENENENKKKSKAKKKKRQTFPLNYRSGTAENLEKCFWRCSATSVEDQRRPSRAVEADFCLASIVSFFCLPRKLNHTCCRCLYHRWYSINAAAAAKNFLFFFFPQSEISKPWKVTSRFPFRMLPCRWSIRILLRRTSRKETWPRFWLQLLLYLQFVSELGIISLRRKKSKECFDTQKCVNHRPWHEKSIPLSIPRKDPPFDSGDQFWTRSNRFLRALFQMAVWINDIRNLAQKKWEHLTGSHSKINTVFKPTRRLRQPQTLFQLAKNTLFRWETFTLQQRNLSHIPLPIH